MPDQVPATLSDGCCASLYRDIGYVLRQALITDQRVIHKSPVVLVVGLKFNLFCIGMHTPFMIGTHHCRILTEHGARQVAMPAS